MALESRFTGPVPTDVRKVLWGEHPWLEVPGAFDNIADQMDERLYERGTTLGESYRTGQPVRMILSGRVQLDQVGPGGGGLHLGPGDLIGLSAVSGFTGALGDVQKMGLDTTVPFNARTCTDVWTLEIGYEAFVQLEPTAVAALENALKVRLVSNAVMRWLWSTGGFWHLSYEDLRGVLPGLKIEAHPQDTQIDVKDQLVFMVSGSGLVSHGACGTAGAVPAALMAGGTGFGVREMLLSIHTGSPGAPFCLRFSTESVVARIGRPKLKIRGMLPLPRAPIARSVADVEPPGSSPRPALAPQGTRANALPTILERPHRIIAPLYAPEVFTGSGLGDLPTQGELCDRLASQLSEPAVGDRVLLLRFDPLAPLVNPGVSADPLVSLTFSDFDQLQDGAVFDGRDVVVIDLEAWQDPDEIVVSTRKAARAASRLPGSVTIAWLFRTNQGWLRHFPTLRFHARIEVVPVAVLGSGSSQGLSTLVGGWLQDMVEDWKERFEVLGDFLGMLPGSEHDPDSCKRLGYPPETEPTHDIQTVPPMLPDEPLPLDAVRVRFAPVGATGVDPNSAEFAASIGRLARAATRRKVGLALGGAGALGLAAIPLIEELHRLGVPVDALSGTSSGSLVGAFYAAEGLPGLQKLELFRDLVPLFLLPGALTSMFSGLFPDLLLGAPDLNQLDTPLHIVATDARTVTETVVRRGSVGLATRASGTLPPFAPLIAAGRSLFDGAYSDDVPGQVLRDADCDMVIGVNPFAKLPALLRPSLLPGGWFRDRALESWPLMRVVDTARANLKLWGFAGSYRKDELDVEFRSGLDALLYPSNDFSKLNPVVEATRGTWELRYAVAQVQQRWRRALRRPPGRFSRSGDSIDMKAVMVFTGVPVTSILRRCPLGLADTDVLLLTELRGWLRTQSDIPARRLQIVGTWDPTIRGISARLLLNPFLAVPAWLLIALIRNAWANAATLAVQEWWNRQNATDLPAIDVDVKIETGSKNAIGFAIVD